MVKIRCFDHSFLVFEVRSDLRYIDVSHKLSTTPWGLERCSVLRVGTNIHASWPWESADMRDLERATHSIVESVLLCMLVCDRQVLFLLSLLDS